MTPNRLIAGIELGEIKNAIIQRNALSEENAVQLITQLKRGAVSYAFELDDNLLKVPLEIDTDRAYQKYGKTLTTLITQASAVSVSTDELKKRISKINPKTLVIPNKISAKVWRGKLNKELSENFVAVYFGTKSHQKDFELILPALTVIAKKHPEFVLLVIGALDDDYKTPDWVNIISVPPAQRNYPAFVPWLKEITKHANVGLAPLEQNSFNKYKSNLKALEYSALGLPVLASAKTVYDSLVFEGPAIKVVENTPNQWIEALTRIIDDKSNSIMQGMANREWVFRNHSFNENDKRYTTWIRG
jgi:glycosyltransferase involved in cell wall biosynthesis